MNARIKLALLIFGALLLISFFIYKYKPRTQLSEVDQINRSKNVPMVEPIARDLPQIRARGSLVVLAPYNSTTYFLYSGEPLGYEYELLQGFAREQNLELKMVVVTDPKSILPLLNSGEGDIAAGRLVPTPESEAHVSFTRALYRTEPALVQQATPPETAGSDHRSSELRSYIRCRNVSHGRREGALCRAGYSDLGRSAYALGKVCARHIPQSGAHDEHDQY
ncbi:MAG: transporter substrate-binding domain-containing protein [Acidobacteria bacterium]|nr:transporter substrate-binding domain-containing protein [Acidobacteriota bacterium]